LKGSVMPGAKRNRGRPKGSGLDDRALLQSVIQLVAKNPELKPTTAIKAIGITDPSAIRRIRDKYNVSRANTGLVHHKPATSDHSNPARTMAMTAAADPVRKGVATPAPAPQRRPSRGSAVGSASDLTCSPAENDRPIPVVAFASPAYRQQSLSWFAIWTELGLQSMAASLRTQWLIYEHVMKSPAVKAAVSSQSALTGFAAAWCATSPDPGKTVH
jgi:hypothetical protein